MARADQTYLIALGSNLPSDAGGPAETLHAARARLEVADVRISAFSRLYETPCFPPGAGPDYVNAAAVVTYAGKPRDMLNVLHKIEAEFGRERVQRWGQRTLDLDLLAAGDLVWPDAQTQAKWRALPLEEQMRQAPGEMVLPHPRLQDRAFVLVPLSDVASDWRHPVLGQTVAEMLAALPEQDVSQVVAV